MPLTEKQKQYQKEYYIKNKTARLAASLARQTRLKVEKREYDKTRRLLKGDQIREYDRIRSKLFSSRVSAMVQRAKQRAKKRGIPFNITIQDIFVPEFCPALGIRLNWADTHGGKFNSPSLDRITPSKGYIKGNVQVISKRANTIKADASVEEIKLVLDWVVSQLADQQELSCPSIENALTL